MLAYRRGGRIASPDVVPGREGGTKETTVQLEHAPLWLRPETVSRGALRLAARYSPECAGSDLGGSSSALPIVAPGCAAAQASFRYRYGYIHNGTGNVDVAGGEVVHD